MNSEELKTTVNRDKLPVFEAVIAERLRPTVTKEMGFQSYEMLEGDGTYRDQQRSAFLAGTLRNPTLDYPKLDVQELSLNLIPLELIISQAEHIADRDAAHAIQTSAAYHEIEMFWLMKAKKLDELKDNPESEEFLEVAQEYQSLNETLYGAPKDETKEQLYGEVIAQGKEKELSPRLRTIYYELLHGTTAIIDGDRVAVPGIFGKDNGQRLPVMSADILQDLHEVVVEDFGFIFDITQKYWDDVIVPRSKENDEESAFSAEDMKAVFEQVRAIIDPENIADIDISIFANKTALSWDTPTMGVQIGEKRSKKIDTPTEMAEKIIHELRTHGGRTIDGLKSELPVLGTGLYTDAEPGESGDYLTFEEGFAVMCEIAGGTLEDTAWTSTYISRYLAAVSLYEGLDFRATFEVNWRARVIMAAKNGVDMSDKEIDQEKKDAYTSCVRIKRGTPTANVDGPILTFNKDLAYLDGKLKVLKYLQEKKGDKAALRRLFTAKFDPTNPIQDALVDKYGIKDNK